MATHTQLPPEEVTELPRWTPWPILYNDLERTAQEDAQAMESPWKEPRKPWISSVTLKPRR